MAGQGSQRRDRSNQHTAQAPRQRLAHWQSIVLDGRCWRWRSAAPGAAHALADALRALDDTAGRNEAAHPAGEGRQASAIRARAAKIASANHLAVATDIEARGLRHEGRSG